MPRHCPMFHNGSSATVRTDVFENIFFCPPFSNTDVIECNCKSCNILTKRSVQIALRAPIAPSKKGIDKLTGDSRLTLY